MELEANEEPLPDGMVKEQDPIIQYLKMAKKNNMPPHKVAFKKLREKEIIKEENDEDEDIAYNLKAIHITREFAEAFS